MHITFPLGVAYLCITLVIVASIPMKRGTCRVTCEEGQQCENTECKPCPNGKFQSEPFHRETSCIPWTDKPADDHWIVRKNGSVKSDIEWACAIGYVKTQITETSFECVKEVVTTTTTPPVKLPTSSWPTTTPVIRHSKSGDLDNGTIIGIVVGCVVVIILIVLICLCRKKALRFLHSKGVPQNGLPVEQVPLRGQKVYADYFAIVRKIGPDNSEKLLFSLHSATSLKIILEFEQKRNNDPEIYYTLSFLEWQKKNPNRNHWEEVNQAIQDLNLHLSAPAGLSKNLFPLFHFLFEKLGAGNAKTFLGLLSEDNLSLKFSPRDFYEHECQKKDKPGHNFAKSLDEFIKRCNENTTLTDLKNHFSSVLTELNRNDIVQDDSYERFFEETSV